MTKDYYKILSLKSDATDGEIRARWIELVKSYHLDFELGEFDEKVKDINDAYHVLKNPATRLEYDLERTFEGKKKGFSLNKWVLRMGIVAVLIVLCVLYFENPEIPRHFVEKSQAVTVLPRIEKRLPISESRKGPTAEVVRVEASALAQIPSPVQPLEEVRVERAEGESGFSDPKQDPIPVLAKPLETGPGDQRKDQETGKSLSSGKASVRKVGRPGGEAPPGGQSGGAAKATQTNRSQKDLAFSAPASKTAGIAAIEKVTKIVQVNTPGPNPGKPTSANSSSLSPLMAREDEVKEFFLNYAKAYTQGDLNVFLALFSPKAVQNGNESFEDLKKTYRRFFSQSQKLNYQLQDLKFEIYRNGIEATARYVLDQIVKRNGERRTWRGTARWILTREGGALKITSLDYKHQESF